MDGCLNVCCKGPVFENGDFTVQIGKLGRRESPPPRFMGGLDVFAQNGHFLRQVPSLHADYRDTRMRESEDSDSEQSLTQQQLGREIGLLSPP